VKRVITLFAIAVATLSGTILVAQQPPAGAPAGPPRPATPPATGAMLDIANHLADAINKQDAAALQKMIAEGAVYLDEDGHAPAASRWIAKVTTNAEGAPAKAIQISDTHSQMWGDAGWVSFNYVLAETINGEPKSIRGTASLMVRKDAAGDWKIQLIHGALYQKVAGLTDAK